LLLDTCAVIWLADGLPMQAAAVTAIRAAALGGGVFISPVSAWEVGLLSRPRGARPPASFSPDSQTWFDRVMKGAGIRLAAFTPAIAIAASLLPGDLHGDPADRLIIATARHLGMPIVTRDARIMAYGDAGHVRVLGC
jgi:PIN domain nuclease of toxin-antitoxin system